VTDICAISIFYSLSYTVALAIELYNTTTLQAAMAYIKSVISGDLARFSKSTVSDWKLLKTICHTAENGCHLERRKQNH